MPETKHIIVEGELMKQSSMDILFPSKEGLKNSKAQLNPFFLRKPYQYTSAETKDEEQQRLHEDDWKNR